MITGVRSFCTPGISLVDGCSVVEQLGALRFKRRASSVVTRWLMGACACTLLVILFKKVAQMRMRTAQSPSANVQPVSDQGGEAPASGCLSEHHQHLIDRTLEESGGNMPRAARALGVSRGLLYRHLRMRRTSLNHNTALHFHTLSNAC